MNKHTIWLIITTILAVCITAYMLSYVVTDPGHTIIMLGGDATKNYFTYLYHILYERGAWFNGMNYPFGSNIFFGDAQPFLSVPLSYLHFNVQQALIVMHFAIVISYILAILFTFKLLVHFNINYLPAVIFALLITILSPQVMRLGVGHYGMAYLCFIPMVFYWTAKYYNNGSWQYTVSIFITGLISGFVHPYFFAFTGIWIMSYSVGYFIFQNIPFKKKVKHTAPLICSVFLIFLIVKCYLLITDPVKDRPQYPRGVLDCRSVKNQLFTSMLSPFWQYIKLKHSSYYISNGNEDGYAYIGMVPIIVCLFSLVSIMLAIAGKKRFIPIASKNSFSAILIFIGFVSLCIGMFIPFKWHIDWFYRYLPFFREFRAVGRFSWIFYYIIAVYAVVVLNYWYRTLVAKNKMLFAYMIMALPIFIWSSEAYGYIKYARKITENGPNNYQRLLSKNGTIHQFLQHHHYTDKDFQAILSLPFFNLGSERLSIRTDADIPYTSGSIASFNLGIPMMENILSRTSLSQTLAQVRIAGGTFTDKEVLQKMDNRPLLLFDFKDTVIDPDYKYLIDASTYIGYYENCKVYACYPQKILANDKKNRDDLLPIINNMASDTCLNCKGSYFIEHFETGKNSKKLFGQKAALPITTRDAEIIRFQLMPSYNNQLYEISAWVLLGKYDYLSPDFTVQILDSADHILQTFTLSTTESVDNSGLWFRISKYIVLPANCRSIRCSARETTINSYLALDEFVMRPAESIIISKFADGAVMANNHVLIK